MDEIDVPEEISPVARARWASSIWVIEGRHKTSCFLLGSSPSRMESTGEESRVRLSGTSVARAWEASTACAGGADSMSEIELNSVVVEATSVESESLIESVIGVSERGETGQHQELLGLREEFSWALAIQAASMREVVCQEDTQVSTTEGCPGRRKGLDTSW